MNTAYNPEVAADKARDPKGNGQSEALTLDTAFPETARVFAEKTVAQTREVYDRSKDALEAAVDTMEKSFDAAGQGAVALKPQNHRHRPAECKFRLRPGQQLGGC
jgi:hypothetical protein